MFSCLEFRVNNQTFMCKQPRKTSVQAVYVRSERISTARQYKLLQEGI